MPSIQLDTVDYHYASPYTEVFSALSLQIDTDWRTGLVGRNGRGKTTLLQLVRGTLHPAHGTVVVPVPTMFFPVPVVDSLMTVREVVRSAVAPFTAWEQRMERLLSNPDETSIAEYGDLLERYQLAGGYDIDARIEREFEAIGLDAAMLDRSWNSLSGGEATRAAIVPLFLRAGVFPLIDEPTNHLDIEGRRMLGNYLKAKNGFIVASHDRAFLDACVDHVISINRDDVRTVRGNYSTWRADMDRELEHERRRNANLGREIRDLEVTARQRRSWSSSREKEKQGAYDKGFVGARAARQMKRALHAEQRVEKMIEEKKDLLRNVESINQLRIDDAKNGPEIVLSVEEATVEIEGRMILSNLSLRVHRGDRIALVGPNGCGKTTLIRAIAGEIPVASGIIAIPRHIRSVRSYQTPLWNTGFLRDHLRPSGIDETRFRTILGSFSVGGEIFDRPLETFSEGERKKVDLCRSFLEPSHLLLWDEPMNYIDLPSREQIEEAILHYQPTMLFVEHDERFVQAVATEVIVIARSKDEGSRIKEQGARIKDQGAGIKDEESRMRDEGGGRSQI